jgi:lipid-binding SYLF domain-containing protein
MNTRTWLGCTGVALAALMAGGCTSTASVTTASSPREAAGLGALSPEQRRDLDEGYRDTLNRLYDTTRGSRELVAKAAGVLVFPRAMSAGIGFVGGEIGTGELRVGNRVDGYYRTTSAALGPQLGAQSKALVFLFMSQDALNRFRASNGWSVGADASVAVLKVGANGEIDVNSARAPTIAFVMTNMGLMANLTLEGTKITRIE